MNFLKMFLIPKCFDISYNMDYILKEMSKDIRIIQDHYRFQGIFWDLLGDIRDSKWIWKIAEILRIRIFLELLRFKFLCFIWLF